MKPSALSSPARGSSQLWARDGAPTRMDSAPGEPPFNPSLFLTSHVNVRKPPRKVRSTVACPRPILANVRPRGLIARQSFS